MIRRKYRSMSLFSDDASLIKINAAKENMKIAEYLRRIIRGRENNRGGNDRIW